MSTSTAPRFRTVDGVNFTSKSDRKRIRKSMIRAYVSNKVADARTGAATRADFYRGLRQMKERRLNIARQMAVLSTMVESAASKAASVAGLVDHVKPTTVPQKKVVNDLFDSVDETVSAAHAAAKSVSGAAEEFAAFAKRRIYYTEAS